MDRHPDPPLAYYKTVKSSLKSIVTDQYVIERLNGTAFMAHRIAIHTLQFLKLYLLHHYETTCDLPIVNHSLILNIMKVIAPKQTKQGRRPNNETLKLKEQIHKFHIQHYQPLMSIDDNIPLSYEHMNTILEYMATNIETTYLNNIKQHFITCIERYINVVSNKKERIDQIKKSSLTSTQKKEQVTILSRLLRGLKTDILDLTKIQFSSDSVYHDFIMGTKKAILPNKSTYERNSVYYDLQCHPQQYLLGMFRMIRAMEAKDVSIMNLFPLRTSMIPKYIKIDTTTLVHLLIDPQKHGYTKSHCISKGNLVRLQDQIWSFFFKTQKRCFYNKQQKYRFNYMIETDGVGCSIQLIHQDLFGRTHIRQLSSPITQERYIDEVPIEVLQSRKLVAIDPNLSDLLYCVTKDQDQVVKLRYTQNQRRKETKSKKYMRLVEQFKHNTQIEGQTVTQWETQLSQYNHKSLIFDRFEIYVQQKNKINGKLLPFYQCFLYRKLRFNGYINQQKSEARFVNRFKKVFGSPDQVVIGVGDYEQHQHRKYKEPVKGKGFRDMFRKAGYRNIYLVDEHRTSSRCHHCSDIVKDNCVVGGECQTFRICQNPRPWRREEQIVRHGLLMCQTCQKLWCRDTNAALNIWKIMKNTQEAKDRPMYLQRGRVSVSNTTSVLPTKLNLSA